MGEISAIAAGRANALRNEARFQQTRVEQTRLAQEEDRRVAEQRQARAIQEQEAARARRLQESIDDRRLRDAERRTFDLDNLAVEDDLRDRSDFLIGQDADDARLEAEQRDADAARPPLDPREPVINLSEGRFPPEEPPPAAPNEPSIAALTADEILLARQGPPAAPEPLPDLGPLDRFPSPEEPVAPPSVALEIQERERNVRVDERREDARTQDTQQVNDLERANEQINQIAQANPNLPPGSIVNVLS